MRWHWWFLLYNLAAASEYKYGASGLNCSMCKDLVKRAAIHYKELKENTEAQSGYNYIDHKPEASFVKKVIPAMKTKVCNSSNLQSIPNPKGYAIHLPTIMFDCYDLLRNVGEDLIDALSLQENMDAFCHEQEMCHKDEL